MEAAATKTINRRWQRQLWYDSSIKWMLLQQKQSTGGGSGSCGMAAALNRSCCNKNQSTAGGSGGGDMVAALNGSCCKKNN